MVFDDNYYQILVNFGIVNIREHVEGTLLSTTYDRKTEGYDERGRLMQKRKPVVVPYSSLLFRAMEKKVGYIY